MNEILKDYLFTKKIFVSNSDIVNGNIEDSFAACAALAYKFAIDIPDQEERKLADCDMVRVASKQLGEYVPEAFYRGFPSSVISMTGSGLLRDQIYHYTATYGMGHFEEAGHSILEKLVERSPYHERNGIKKFRVVNETNAIGILIDAANDMVSGSRPLSDFQMMVIFALIEEYGYFPKSCASKNTAVRLLLHTRDTRYSSFLSLPDVIKVVDEMNFTEYGNKNIKKLNLKNQDRKFISNLIDIIDLGGSFGEELDVIRECAEKKAIWCGLLHHIHYKPVESKEYFVSCMHGDFGCSSAYSSFEHAMAKGCPVEAAKELCDAKGPTAVARHLDYILSRCHLRDVRDVISTLRGSSAISLMQLYLHYKNYISSGNPRTFAFQKYGMVKAHHETQEEVNSRKSMLSDDIREVAASAIKMELDWALSVRVRLGDIYISPKMYKIAFPIQEGTSQGGFGVLPKGSRIPIDTGKKIRAFTYWEKVNDIDLSMFVIDIDGTRHECSWRTMYSRQSSAITFSGDQTSGYNGGSEFFDVDIQELRKLYPNAARIIFCNNVYSGCNFSECICRAGFMYRDAVDSGKIFEPKTAESSFIINSESTFAYLFGIDILTNEFVWLNCARDSHSRIAADDSDMTMLDRYFTIANYLNVGSVFRHFGNVVNDPEEADVVVSDIDIPDKEMIHSYDVEKMLKYIE